MSREFLKHEERLGNTMLEVVHTPISCSRSSARRLRVDLDEKWQQSQKCCSWEHHFEGFWKKMYYSVRTLNRLPVCWDEVTCTWESMTI